MKKLESVLYGHLGWISPKLFIMVEQRIFDSLSLSASGKLPSTVGIQCSSEYDSFDNSSNGKKSLLSFSYKPYVAADSDEARKPFLSK